jgi:hypothetical protein
MEEEPLTWEQHDLAAPRSKVPISLRRLCDVDGVAAPARAAMAVVV